MINKPIDPSAFSVNERSNEYTARFDVTGEISVSITAASMGEAKAKAKAMLEDDCFGLELDEVTDTRIASVWKDSPMYRVTREGKKMQVTHLSEGDEPREPDERGF